MTRTSVVVSTLPVLAPAACAAFGLVCMLALLADAFSLKLVLPAGGLAVLVVWRAVGRSHEVVEPEQVWADRLALVAVVGFAVFNARYASQNVFVVRDPGIYTDTAQWLVGHSSLDIDPQPLLFAKGVPTASSGFGYALTPGHLYAQGSHLLPALLAVIGRLFGVTMMFAANAVIGAFGLLAVYGFARRLVRPRIALAGMVLLGLTLPELAFSRDSFTEPLTQLLVFGGLALLWDARRRGGWPRHAVAGLVLGATALARPDAQLVMTSLVLFAVLALAVTPRAARAASARDLGAVVGAAALCSVIGLRDLQTQASGYYSDRRSELLLIGLATAAVALAGAGVVAIVWRTSALERLDRVTARVRARAVAVVVVLVMAVLVTRPLWLNAHGADPRVPPDYVANLQRAVGAAVDPDRTYAESSLTWITWYVGPVAVLLAVIGLAVLVARAGRGQLPFLAVLGVEGLLYVVRPSIVPDQIWVMRRYLPVVLPGVMVCAAVGFEVLRGRAARPRLLTRATAVALLLPVVFISYPLARVREGTPQLAEIGTVCDALPDDAAVVVLGSLARPYSQTVRSFCQVPVIALGTSSDALLAQISGNLSKNGFRAHVLLDAVDSHLVSGAIPGPVLSRVTVRVWNASLVRPPRAAHTVERSLRLGLLDARGQVAEWLEGPR